jgi:hypothetical protein
MLSKIAFWTSPRYRILDDFFLLKLYYQGFENVDFHGIFK